MANHFDTVNDRADVTVTAWQNHDGLRRAIEQGKPLPDVFLVSRRDLRWFVESGLTRPVDTLLDERGVDFGDVYSRDALEAFSSDNRLQCMPYGVSPQVVFYNESMIDFDRMELRGLDVPERPPALELGPVRRRGEVRRPSVPRHQGRLDRPDAARARTLRLLRRRRPVRRRLRARPRWPSAATARRAPSRPRSRCSATRS